MLGYIYNVTDHVTDHVTVIMLYQGMVSVSLYI